MKQNPMRLRYTSPAPVIDDFLPYSTYGCAWERYSLPLGNGFFGANIFGRLGTERIQISDPTLCNPYYVPKTVPRIKSCASGVNSMAEILIDFNHEDAFDYERSLSIDDAIHTVRYTHGGVRFTRTSFASHPDRVLVTRIESDKCGSVSFKVKGVIPFIGEYNIEPGDGMAKSGVVSARDGELVARGKMEYYGILFEYRLRVVTVGGKVTSHGDAVSVEGADRADIIFSCATNYRLCEEVFLEDDPKKKLHGMPDPSKIVADIMSAAESKGYDALLRDHLADYRALFGRVTLNIYDAVPDAPTDELVRAYRAGERSSYLEMLLYQYGRYLMICASRTQLPAHLQGLWNAFSDAPWSCGYWHNINLQMNYWSVGSANLSELFIPYVNYAKAYMPLARRGADKLVAEKYPDRLSPAGENGWIIGTGGWPYTIEGFKAMSHSGPGTGAFTALLFWDHYDYTRDDDFLCDFGYPALRSMSLLYTKLLVERDGLYLIEDSASPEQVVDGKYYHTVGCAFDQQMVYECFKRTVDSARILGISDDFTAELERMLPRLEPVLVGDDGQVKEYREETYYSSIGEPEHRHVSHLVGLYPGTVINEDTPEWMNAAKVTLDRRGDRTHCWAAAHRMLLWARTGNGKRAMDLLRSLIENNVMDNLWDSHPPYQIDGCFGLTAGVGEMLVGGYDGVVRILPALPDEWQSGEFSGIVSKGGVVFDCRWQNGIVTYLAATSRTDTVIDLRLPVGSPAIENSARLPLKAGVKCVLIG